MDNARTAELVLDSAADPEYFVLRLHFRDTNVRGKEAYVTLSVETEVRDSRPVNESEELFREDFVIEGLDREIRIPRVRVPHYSYAGKRINMLIHTKLVIDDALIFDTTISEPQEIALGLRPPGPFDSPDLIDPHDAFDFLKNIKAVPAKNRYVIFAVGGAVLLGWGALVLVLLNLKSGVIQLGIFGTAVGLFLTALAYSYMRHLLAAYVNLKLKRLDEPIRRDTKLRASDLFEGFTFSAAKNCTLRIIAYNTEHGQYRRGSGTKVRTVSFSDPLRVLKLYEKKLDIIPRIIAWISTFRTRSISPGSFAVCIRRT